jgi:hypothetical protein
VAEGQQAGSTALIAGFMSYRAFHGILALLLVSLRVDASEPVWVFIEPPSAEAEHDFKKAKQDAERDIAAGVLKTRVSGMWGPDETRSRLLAKLGIQEVGVGCVPIETVWSRAYYEAMDREIERRHGPDFWSRFEGELAASRASASSSSAAEDPAADLKYTRAVADHVQRFWKVPPNVPGGRRCTVRIRFDSRLTSAETETMACPDSRLKLSVQQTVQASLPLPAEIEPLRTPRPVYITFEIPHDQVGEDEVDWWEGEWRAIQSSLRP